MGGTVLNSWLTVHYESPWPLVLGSAVLVFALWARVRLAAWRLERIRQESLARSGLGPEGRGRYRGVEMQVGPAGSLRALEPAIPGTLRARERVGWAMGRTGDPDFDAAVEIEGRLDLWLARADESTRALLRGFVREPDAKLESGVLSFRFALEHIGVQDYPVDLCAQLALAARVPASLFDRVRRDPIAALRVKAYAALEERYPDASELPLAEEALRQGDAATRLCFARHLRADGAELLFALLREGEAEEAGELVREWAALVPPTALVGRVSELTAAGCVAALELATARDLALPAEALLAASRAPSERVAVSLAAHLARQPDESLTALLCLIDDEQHPGRAVALRALGVGRPGGLAPIAGLGSEGRAALRALQARFGAERRGALSLAGGSVGGLSEPEG